MFSTADAISLRKNELLVYTEKRAVLHKFLNDIPHFIPCESCETHAKTFQLQYPLPANETPVEDAKIFFHWSCDYHNAVNQSIGKRTHSYEEAEAYYQPSYLENQKLNDYQLARFHDSNKIKLLELEIDNMKINGPPCRVDYRPLAAVSVLCVLFAIIAGVLFFRKL